jgi:hypothetical protein
MIRPTFTEATDAAEALNLTRHGLLQAAREGKLVAWLQPETNPQRPFIVRAGKRQPTAESTGRKLAMPDGQFLVFERDAMVNLRGKGCLDLSVLTEQNHALLLSAYRGHDGVTVELMPGVVLGDGAGNFYEVASEGPRTMALVGFMTKDLEALRAAHDAEPAASQEPVNKQTPSGASEQRQAERWAMCEAAGLKMPTDTYAHYPRGIGMVAKKMGIELPSLREDLNKHRARIFSK